MNTKIFLGQHAEADRLEADLKAKGYQFVAGGCHCFGIMRFDQPAQPLLGNNLVYLRQKLLPARLLALVEVAVIPCRRGGEASRPGQQGRAREVYL